jgi:adenine-specific DNA-methyltransferase
MRTKDTNPLDDVSSPDINAERLAALNRLFPDLFSNEGRLNVDELKKLVDPTLVTESERYDFRWYGKTASKREAFTPSRAALIFDPTRSINPEKASGNIIIEGENLEVLKLLNCAYRERVKCIYIDPPYNTGNDFVYSDRFAEGQKPYWEQTGVTENGVKVDSNSESDGRFHSNWLSMIHSRLLVARYLLRPDGVIFVSIDDSEVHNLRRVMNEVFGDENFLATLCRRTKTGGGSAAHHFAVEHDYILAYARNAESVAPLFIPHDPEYLKRYALEDEKGRFFWDTMQRSCTQTTPYTIVAPDGTLLEGDWFRSESRFKLDLEAGEVRFLKKDDGKWSVQFKQRLGEGRKIRSLLHENEFKSTQDEINDLGLQDCFSFPKPTNLINILTKAACKESDIILDFFGGSGTTAQAVMELNKSDGGNRQFILVQLPELTPEESPAYKAGFKRISDITIERTKRVIRKIQKEAEDILPGESLREFADSLGCKVYTLAKSRFPRVEFAPDPEKNEVENVEALKRYIAEKEQSFHIQLDKEPVRDEVLLKQGFMFDYTLTPQPAFTKNEVVLARDAYKESLLCLDAVIAPETVDYFQTHKDRFFICLELALDTTKKWNLKHHLGDKLKTI